MKGRFDYALLLALFHQECKRRRMDVQAAAKSAGVSRQIAYRLGRNRGCNALTLALLCRWLDADARNFVVIDQ